MSGPRTITIPGAVDLHVHFREPGDNKAETIASGSMAALMGGYSLVCDMPNNPGNPTWTFERLNKKQSIIARTSHIPMATYAGAQPESDNLNELAEMAKTAVGLKLYGAATTGNHKDYEPEEFDEIIRTWHKVTPNKPIMLHSGKDNLANFIDMIAKKHGHQLHICHINSAENAALAVKAKKDRLNVTSGVCPHHFLKSSHHVVSEGWFTRMQPPLLHQDEAEELFRLFVAGDIDILETDHAPHSLEDKWAAEHENPEAIHDPNHRTCFGVPGIEFALPLLFYQMERGRISLERIVEATSTVPAQIIGIKLSPETKVTWKMIEYRIADEHPKGLSGSGWTPYLNNLALGKVWTSIIGGKTLVQNGKMVASLPLVAQAGDSL